MNTYTVLTTPTLSVTVHADKLEAGEVIKFYKDKELIASFPNSCSVYTASNPAPEDKGKKIEFVHGLATDRSLFKHTSTPGNYKNVELVRQNFGEYDLIIAYDDDRSKGVLYLGHYNDGIK